MEKVDFRILIINSNEQAAREIKQDLQQEGFEAWIATEEVSALNEALSENFHLALIYSSYPRMDGRELLRKIRTHSELPILILTEGEKDIDRIVCLEMGADDSVAQPCLQRELVARIRAILRRAAQRQANETGEPITIGAMTLWPQRRVAAIDGSPLTLTSTEFSLLEFLSRHAGSVVSKHDLALAALGRPLSAYDRSIDVHISSIRHKLGPRPDDTPWIHTVRGKGYQFIQE